MSNISFAQICYLQVRCGPHHAWEKQGKSWGLSLKLGVFKGKEVAKGTFFLSFNQFFWEKALVQNFCRRPNGCMPKFSILTSLRQIGRIFDSRGLLVHTGTCVISQNEQRVASRRSPSFQSVLEQAFKIERKLVEQVTFPLNCRLAGETVRAQASPLLDLFGRRTNTFVQTCFSKMFIVIFKILKIFEAVSTIHYIAGRTQNQVLKNWKLCSSDQAKISKILTQRIEAITGKYYTRHTIGTAFQHNNTIVVVVLSRFWLPASQGALLFFGLRYDRNFSTEGDRQERRKKDGSCTRTSSQLSSLTSIFQRKQ